MRAWVRACVAGSIAMGRHTIGRRLYSCWILCAMPEWNVMHKVPRMHSQLLVMVACKSFMGARPQRCLERLQQECCMGSSAEFEAMGRDSYNAWMHAVCTLSRALPLAACSSLLSSLLRRAQC